MHVRCHHHRILRASSVCCSLPLQYKHGIQPNGMHTGENDVAPYHVADSNRLGEAYRLIASVAAGGKPLTRVRLEPPHPEVTAFAVDGGQVKAPIDYLNKRSRTMICLWRVSTTGN